MQRKEVKRKKTFFWHPALCPTRTNCTVPKVNRGKLFGKELGSICHEGKWPTVVLVGLTWLISGSPKENLVKQWVLTDLLWLTLRWVVYMKRLMHKTSLRSSLTLPSLTLNLCKPFVWFSQAHRFLFCMTGNRYFPFFYSGYSIPHKGKRPQNWGHIPDISKCEIMQKS